MRNSKAAGRGRVLSAGLLCCFFCGTASVFGQASGDFDPPPERSGRQWSPKPVEMDFSKFTPRAEEIDDFGQTDELMISFPSDRLDQVLDLCRNQGIDVNEIVGRDFFGNASHFFLRGKIPKGFNRDLLQQLVQNGNIRDVEANRRREFHFPKPVVVTSTEHDPRLFRDSGGTVTPNDPALRLPGTWGLDRIRAPRAWSVIQKSVVTVAVIDTGVDYAHGDLRDNVARRYGKVHGYDFCGDTQSEDADPADIDGHGTHCAGILGSVGNNGTGLTGVCWSVPVLPVKIFRQGQPGLPPVGASDAEVTKAIYYAVRQGARVINCSFGHPGQGSRAVLQALQYAAKNDCLVIVAAGNDGINIDEQQVFPATVPLDNILVVAAVDQNDQRPDWGGKTTNYGRREVDIAAPGHGIYSCAPGSLNPQGYVLNSGTSMAAPFVAGAAALVWSHPKYRDLSAIEIKQLLLSKARKVPSLAETCSSSAVLDIGFLADGEAPPPLADATLPPPQSGSTEPPLDTIPDQSPPPSFTGTRLSNNPVFWDGYRAWRDIRYKEAIADFRQAADDVPDDARPEYFHAISRLALKQDRQFANRLYEALQRESGSPLGPYAWGAMMEFFQGPQRARLEAIRRKHLETSSFTSPRQILQAWQRSASVTSSTVAAR
ncbi:MAG: S8 family serine peptidase [Rhodopirellula sp.]|nr:S8 family serine peptidase [Rhodopirellula sp.]